MQILYETGSAHVVKEIDPEKYEKLNVGICVNCANINVNEHDETTEPTGIHMSNMEYKTKENYMSVTKLPKISSDNLSAPQTVDRLTYQPVSNFNLNQDNDISKEKLLAKKKDEEKFNKLSEKDSEPQPESGRSELDSRFVENVKRDIAMVVCPEKVCNKLGSLIPVRIDFSTEQMSKTSEFEMSCTSNMSVPIGVQRCMFHLGSDCYLTVNVFKCAL
ncbi:uncharacterized protein [Mytilus edulis]|uniref:uncharacterized protein isoform X1 n=1 Tax=Mytilus edulis TaxID=6550 RepID=UPI0039F14AA9